MSDTHLQRIVLCAALVLVSTPAWAKEGWYAGVKGGVVGGADTDVAPTAGTLTKNAEIGPAIMGTIGYADGNGARMEGEISWRKNDVDTDGLTLAGLPFDLNLENLAFMVNGAYDVQLNSQATSFIMGGIGFSRVSGTLEHAGADFDEDDIVFAYQFGTGLAFPVTDSVSFNVSYRFFGTTEPELDSRFAINNTHHNGLFGLTYSF